MLAVDPARVPALSPVAMHSGGGGSLRCFRGEFHDSRPGGCGAASPLIKEAGPTLVFAPAFGGGQGVGAGFRPAASRPTERNGMRLWSRRRTERCPLGLNRVPDRFLRSAGHPERIRMRKRSRKRGASRCCGSNGGAMRPPIEEGVPMVVFNGCIPFLWPGSCGAASPPIKEVGPTRRNPCPRTSNPCAASPPLDEFGSTVVFEAAFNGEHGVGSAFEQRCLSPYPRKMGRTRMGCTLGAYGEWSVVRWA